MYAVTVAHHYSKCMLLQWHIITCFYTIHIHIVFKIYKILRSNVNTNCVMLFLFPAHITTHKTDISWPQLADFLRLKELELVPWNVRSCSLTARSLDDPSNQTAGHHITSQQTLMLLLTNMTKESRVSCIRNHTKFVNLHYSTSSWYTVDGIATSQWLGSTGFKSRKGQHVLFYKMVQTGPGAHPMSYAMSMRVLCWGWCSQDMKLTTHLHLVLRLKMGGAVPLHPYFPSCTNRDNFTFCINPPTGTKIARKDIGRYIYMKISVCTLDNMRTLTCTGWTCQHTLPWKGKMSDKINITGQEQLSHI
jgi:hypothetical protein